MSRLLVLDDQEGVAYSTGVLLRRAGYYVDTCCQVDKATSLALRTDCARARNCRAYFEQFLHIAR